MLVYVYESIMYKGNCSFLFFFSSRRRHTRCALVTGVQTCALPISIPVDRGNAAKMDVKHFRTLRKVALADQIDHALHRLAFVNRVRDHTFEPRRKSDRLQGFLRRYAVRGISIVLLDNDVLVDNLVATTEGRSVDRKSDV